ncbi:MAG: hypothetical protein OIF38_09265, partial [Cellvibrionaceae bacterium]|nr:hypothetical protein [Cellvibrionaceae bacterium]
SSDEASRVPMLSTGIALATEQGNNSRPQRCGRPSLDLTTEGFFVSLTQRLLFLLLLLASGATGRM